jgi:hypothetical protein
MHIVDLQKMAEVLLQQQQQQPVNISEKDATWDVYCPP